MLRREVLAMVQNGVVPTDVRQVGSQLTMQHLIESFFHVIYTTKRYCACFDFLITLPPAFCCAGERQAKIPKSNSFKSHRQTEAKAVGKEHVRPGCPASASRCFKARRARVECYRRRHSAKFGCKRLGTGKHKRCHCASQSGASRSIYPKDG